MFRNRTEAEMVPGDWKNEYVMQLYKAKGDRMNVQILGK